MSTPQEKAQLVLNDCEDLAMTVQKILQTHIDTNKPLSVRVLRDRLGVLVGLMPADLRPATTRFFNAVSGLFDEVREGDRTARQVQRDLQMTTKEFVDMVRVNLRKDLEGGQDERVEFLRTARTIESRLQTAIMRKSVVVVSDAPILPMVSLSSARLRAAGIGCVDLVQREGSRSTALGPQALQGYVALTNQKVVGVSKAYIAELLEGATARGAAAKEKLLEGAYQEVLDIFHARHPGHEVLGEPYAWWEARWFWLMPKRELAVLRRVAGSSFAVKRWSFAFQSH